MRRRYVALALGSTVALLSYLTMPPAQAAPAAPSAHVHAVVSELRSMVYHPDGTATMTTWSLAPGVDAEQVYTNLKAQGAEGLVSPTASGSVGINEVDCSIQGAYAWGRRCGINQYHWSGTHPAVYFIDHTSAAWPVYEAVVKWNESTALDSGYRWYTNGCPNTHCVQVYNANYGNNGWVGSTSISLSGTTITAATILLNDYYPNTAKWHRETSCHEEGHALGLDHNLFESSCLYYTHTTNRSQYPGPGDWQVLHQIY
jgi:hypothetical protein